MKVRSQSAAKAARMLAFASSLAGLLLATAQLPVTTATETPMRWTAEWIWPSTAALATHDNQFILFRKTFTISNAPQEAHLTIFADSRYRLYINGTYAAQGPSPAPHY